MEARFWHQKWNDNNIGFHEQKPNDFLTGNFGRLKLAHNTRIFLPLCGKTLDIAWILSKGYKIVGAELSPLAIEQLFETLKLTPKITDIGNLQLFSAPNIDIFVGDIFDVSSKMLGKIDAVYDRAALVALPQDMRSRYTQHLMKITNNAAQLLVCFEYDQSLTQGPPFSIDEAEIRKHYAPYYALNLVDSRDMGGMVRGISIGNENVWL